MNHTESLRNADCQHHWVIDQADGPTSSGRCRLCGTKKSFLNVYEDVVAELEARGIEPQASVSAAARRRAA
jgi:hypothetical protein